MVDEDLSSMDEQNVDVGEARQQQTAGTDADVSPTTLGLQQGGPAVQQLGWSSSPASFHQSSEGQLSERAAEAIRHIERSDSVLSSSSEEDGDGEKDGLHHQRTTPAKGAKQARSSSIAYMEEASMEACRASPSVTRIHASGTAGRRRPSRVDEEAIIVSTATERDPRRGYANGSDNNSNNTVSELPASNGGVESSHDEVGSLSEAVSGSEAAPSGCDESPIADYDEGIHDPHHRKEETGTAAGPPPLRRPVMLQGAEESAPRSASAVLRQYSLLPTTMRSPGEEACEEPIPLLVGLFEGFCHPQVDAESAQAAWDGSVIPASHHQAVIRCHRRGTSGTGATRSKSGVVALLTAGYPDDPALFRLPPRFSVAFLNLVIQLLSGGGFGRDDDNTKAINNNSNGEETQQRQQQENDKQLLYSAARFQCNDTWAETVPSTAEGQETPAQSVLWKLCQQAASSARGRGQNSVQLLEPLTRLLGLLCTAGVTPRILQCLLGNASTAARPCFVRALLTATKTSNHMNDFFCLDSTCCSGSIDEGGVSGEDDVERGTASFKTGLRRTLSGRQWPFRNDFCFATTFRAECFHSGDQATTSDTRRFSSPRNVPIQRPVILMSCRASNGAGFEVRFVPPSPQQNCAVIQVCVFDSSPPSTASPKNLDNQEKASRILTVRQCVLLPRVWYHFAVRHTRSRMKGVFSLSTRQQVSVMLNGKVLMTESCNFPKMEDASPYQASSLLPKPRSSSMKGSNLVNVTLAVGENFDGQIGPAYFFDDNISDASLRALQELSSKKTKLRRRPTLNNAADDNKWDSHQSSVVKKSRVLDVNITNDDAEEIVLSQRRGSISRPNIAAIDAVADSDEDVDTALRKANFSSKLFVVWDPRRAVNDTVVEIHIGAHVKLDHAFGWSASRAQDVISSIGGIQVLIPLFRSVITDSSTEVGQASASGSALPSYPEAISDMISLLRSFVQDHNDNARELLRCGGIDVIEQILSSNRKGPIFRNIHSDVAVARSLVQALLELRSACSHYVGLETKVFSRLLFNIPLWLGGGSGKSIEANNALLVVLLPILSSLTRANPEKVRDCVGIKDMVHALKENLEEYGNNDAPIKGSLSNCQQVADVLLGMIFEVLLSGVTPQDLSPLLNFLTFHLESEWIDAVQGGDNLTAYRRERQRLTANLSTSLLFLLQVRPPVPGLFESFAQCCGGVQSGAAWILSSMVNSHSDKVRSLGVRCVAAFLDVVSKSADSPLSVGVTLQNSDSAEIPTPDISSHSSVLRLGIIAKGLVAMGPGVRSMVIPPSKLTARIVMKLVWHLLKSHRTRLGPHTYAALLCWISDDGGILSSPLSSANHLQKHLIAASNMAEPGYRFCIEWADGVLAETGNVVGRSFRTPLALGVVLRLLRYLNDDIQDQWLADLLTLAKASRKSTSMMASLPEWQPCLFHLISETLEVFSSSSLQDAEYIEEDGAPVGISSAIGRRDHVEKKVYSLSRDFLESVGTRLDRCLELYSTLLGYLFREGGDKVRLVEVFPVVHCLMTTPLIACLLIPQALDAVEMAASLQRVCVNGHDVVFLVLSGLCADVFDNGTLLEIGSIPAQEWKSVDIEQESLPLKQSARLVTDAILSNGTKGLDMTTAVRSWRSLRHLMEIIVAMVIKSG